MKVTLSPLIIGALTVIGIGFAFFSSPNTNAIMSSVEKKDYSIASSVTATSRSIGHTLSMAVVTTVVAVTIGNITLAEASAVAVLHAMRISFIIFYRLLHRRHLFLREEKKQRIKIRKENRFIMTEKELDMLRNAGIDAEKAVQRLMGKEHIFLRYLQRFADDENCDHFLSSLEKKDYQEAFRAVHTLKGRPQT